MVLVLMVPSYDAKKDVLRLELSQGPVAHEEVLSQHIHASYTDQSELVAITVRSARVDSSRILATALYAVGQVGIQQVDSLMLIVAAVMLRYFGAIPALGALPETHRNDAGFFVESVARTLLTADAAEAVLSAIEPFKPVALGDQLAVDWQASGSLLLRDAQQPALEYVRTKKFDSLMQQALVSDNADRPSVVAAATPTSTPDNEFYRLVASAGYGTPRSLPKKTEAKLRKLIHLARTGTVAAPPQRQSVCRGLDALIRRSLSAEGDEMRMAAAECSVDQQSYPRRVEAAADQLHALATAKTDAYRQAQLANIDWQLVAEEFASVAGRYAGSIQRYAALAIANIAEKLITYRDSVDLLHAMSDLEAHLVDFDPAEVDDDIAQAWDDSVDELDIARGIVRNIAPIRTLEVLRAAAGEKLAAHRKLDQESAAYRSGWSVLHTDQAVADLLWVESLPMAEKVAILTTGLAPEWQKTTLVLARAAVTMSLPVCEAVLAELSRAIPLALEAGSIEARGDTELWEYSELRRVQ